MLYATLLRFSFSNKRKRKAQIESRMDKPETKATHDTEQKETTVKKIQKIKKMGNTDSIKDRSE